MSILKKVIIFILVIMLMILTQNITLAAQGTVNTETLNVRKNAESNAEIIDHLKLNVEVTVIENVDSTWAKVKVKQTEGYVVQLFGVRVYRYFAAACNDDIRHGRNAYTFVF